ncbi:outer membrane protein assembly factor BamB family protein [Rhodohalobacter sp. 614A]|uniref:outer membrane protein assembly factor BamB family protein n=1 Tax=Rhodohalobacter sp. 614A TaxID=2908649 RepID=UPI001F3F6865|nr:PQQ-binding-like beta-propeller repeat protein [Rhodohalobacter sp. 614A]
MNKSRVKNRFYLLDRKLFSDDVSRSEYPDNTYFRKLRIVHFLLIMILIGCESNRDYSPSEWPIYKSDEGSSSFSELTQINTENVSRLEVAWTFYPQDVPEGRRYRKVESNPVVIDDVMYVTDGGLKLYALDADTGQQIWRFDPFDGEGGRGLNRGVTYWEDGDDKRILFTAGEFLFAVNAITGKAISSFGKNGKVSLNEGLGVDSENISVSASSPGAVYQDILIMGSQLSEDYGEVPGHIRAYNVRTGEMEWTFHTIPHPGEPGYQTWPKDAWKYIGGVNNWAGMSVDRERGWVFLPLGSPTYDFYGGNRLGKNLYGNSLLVLDAKTGEYIWHYQIVHHDLWDYDLPAPPNLVTVERNGEDVDAVAQLTKMGFLFLFDRETGEPLFPVEEKEVPESHLPGEEAWPTQPFPLKPEPFVDQHITPDDLNRFSEASYDTILKKLQSLRHEGLYTPPSHEGTLNSPGTRGGAEWGGAAYDAESHMLYFISNNWPEIVTLRKLKEPSEEELADQSVYERGRTLYETYCASCHGLDRSGQEGIIPSLLNVKERLSRRDAYEVITEGGGRMQSFESILDRQQRMAITAYLYDIKDEEMSPVQQRAEQTQRMDTTARYTNITPFRRFEDSEKRHAVKPPWGKINALNLNTGEYEWTTPLGNHPDLQKEGEPETGMQTWPGPIATAGGILINGGTSDRKFRAYDSKTGVKLWEATLPGTSHAIPATYMVGGKQYIVISVSGTEELPGGAIVAFALPD